MALCSIVADGIVLLDRRDMASSTQHETKVLLDAGPRRLDARTIDALRYKITDALIDLGASNDREERLSIGCWIIDAASDLLFDRRGVYPEGGKRQIRALRACDPQRAAALVVARRRLACEDNDQLLTIWAREILDEVGGPVYAGFRQVAELPQNDVN